MFRLASRADVCEAQSRITTLRREDGKTNEGNDLHSFRDTCRRCIVVLPSNSVADIGKLVRLSLDLSSGSSMLHQTSQMLSLRCARRLSTSQAFAPAYRRSTSSVSSATFAVPCCRLESSPSDMRRPLSLDLDTSATVARNSMCDGCCRAFDGR